MKNLNIFSLTTEYDNAKSGGVLNKPNVSFINEDSSVRYLVDIKIEYEYVDLGLPSGLKWATCNVGASNPQDYGLYFAWGETTGYTAEQVKSGERSFGPGSYKAASISTNLTLEQDAAHIYMGGKWRMPTQEEYRELLDNCEVTWTTDYNSTGIAGIVFTSNVNGNSVFFPASGYCFYSSVDDVGKYGYYWAASWYLPAKSLYLYFNSSQNYVTNYDKYHGFSVRGVCE